MLLAVPQDTETSHRVQLEIARLEKRQQKSAQALEALEKRRSDAQYPTKVPEEIRNQDEQRVKQLETELHATTKSLAALLELQTQVY